jgi:RNA polymerase sigma-70 factor (ECF subfamily)
MASALTPERPEYLEDPASLEDDLLLEAIALGDKTAFQDLMRRHSSSMIKLAERFLRNPADADDVVQEAFLKVWTSAADWRPDGSAKFSTWLYRIVTNACIDRIRRKRAFVDVDEAPDLPDHGPDGLTASIRRKAYEVIISVLAGLPERQREALSLFYMADIGGPELARRLELSTPALDSLLSRGRKALRAALHKRGITTFGEVL